MNLQIFENNHFGKVRVFEKNGEPWFIAKDIAETLDYRSASDMTRILDEDEKDMQIVSTLGGHQNVTVINESGFYSAILRSRKEEAKKFKKWVTSEVIPAIRKHGAYMTEETIEKVLSDPDTIIQLANRLKEEKAKRQLVEAKIEEQKPKVLFADAVSASKTSILVGELAKMLNQNGVDIGQNRLFIWLRENGYLIKRKGADYNMPTQYSMNLGLFEIKETTINHSAGHITISKTPKVTGKGQLYFISKLNTKVS